MQSICMSFFCYFALSPISRALAAIFIEGAHVLSLFLGGITKISYTRILFAARALFKVKHTSIWAAKRKLGSFQRKERTLLIFFSFFHLTGFFYHASFRLPVVVVVLFFFWLHALAWFGSFFYAWIKCFLNLFQYTLLIHGNKLLLKTLLYFVTEILYSMFFRFCFSFFRCFFLRSSSFFLIKKHEFLNEKKAF